MATSRRGRSSRNPRAGKGVDWDDLGAEPTYIPSFVPGRRLADNVFSITRPLWGKALAEWVMCLAVDLVAVRPEADGAERREWTVAILWAAALDTRMNSDERLWAEVVDDITTATGVDEDSARAWFERLRDLGLERPRHPPAYWDED